LPPRGFFRGAFFVGNFFFFSPFQLRFFVGNFFGGPGPISFCLGQKANPNFPPQKKAPNPAGRVVVKFFGGAFWFLFWNGRFGEIRGPPFELRLKGLWHFPPNFGKTKKPGEFFPPNFFGLTGGCRGGGGGNGGTIFVGKFWSFQKWGIWGGGEKKLFFGFPKTGFPPIFPFGGGGQFFPGPRGGGGKKNPLGGYFFSKGGVFFAVGGKPIPKGIFFRPVRKIFFLMGGGGGPKVFGGGF